MAFTNAQKAKLGGALAALIAAATAVAVLGPPSGNNHGDLVKTTLNDAGMKHLGEGGTTTDLLSSIIQPGAEMDVGVNLPSNTGGYDATGSPQFDIISITRQDREPGLAWVVVRVKNKTGTEQRFAGFLTFDMVPVDAGVDAL